MNPQRLVEMLNDIAANQSALPHDEALETVVVHVQRFWAPSMRDGILGYARDDGDGLLPLAHEAVTELKRRTDELAPPTRRGASDAG